MSDFLKLLRRFAFPYRANIFLSLFFNILTAILTLFSFAFIIPILQMLFRISEAKYEYMALGSASLKDVLINNFYYYTGTVISDYGPSMALAFLAAVLVVMTLLKVLAAYFSEYYTVPMRNGIVRDIRNEMYAKLLTLPIGFLHRRAKGRCDGSHFRRCRSD